MQTVLLAQIPKGSAVSVTVSAAVPIPPPPPWMAAYYGWIAYDCDDRIIYFKPGCPLVARSAAQLIKKLLQKGLVIYSDDE